MYNLLAVEPQKGGVDMATRQYIGARYVPIIDGEWDVTKEYDPLVIVMYQGNSYTSRTFVPANTPITNTTYWALTGNYNAQVEAYRRDVQGFMDAIIPATKYARGDGYGDDTEELQVAINNSYGKVLDLCGKTYLITDTLHITDSIVIQNGKLLSTGTSDSDKFWGVNCSASNVIFSNIDFELLSGGVLIHNCDNVMLLNCMARTYNTWNTYFYGCNTIFINNFKPYNDIGTAYPLQNDGLHFVGCSNIIIDGVCGCSNDDLICIQTDKDEITEHGLTYPAYSGEVTNVLINNVSTSTALCKNVASGLENCSMQVINFNLKSSKTKNIIVNNINCRYFGAYAILFAGHYLDSSYSSDIDNVQLTNINIDTADSLIGGYACIEVQSPKIESISLDGVFIKGSILGSSRIIRFRPENTNYNVTIDNISINNLIIKYSENRTITEWGSRYCISVDSNCTVDSLSITNCSIKTYGLYNIVDTTGNVNSTLISNCYFDLDTSDENKQLFIISNAKNVIFTDNICKLDINGANCRVISCISGYVHAVGNKCVISGSNKGFFIEITGSIDEMLCNANTITNFVSLLNGLSGANIDIITITSNGCINCESSVVVRGDIGYLCISDNDFPIIPGLQGSNTRVRGNNPYAGSAPINPIEGDEYINSGHKYIYLSGSLHQLV